MSALLLSVHVLAAILTIGPVAVTASMFPRFARLALDRSTDPHRDAVVRVLHRITRNYAVIGVLVPVCGLATGASIGVLGDAWLIVSIVLTAGAGAMLIGVVLPGQRRTLRCLDVGAEPADLARVVPRLGMHAGIFNLLWAIVVVLMIYRPGSTTGVGL
ncbi:DUF2269 family protein [Salinispora cortesiana]|uniref:DUF2269 family protein n=1 Tax=Salinispora cortesiana TaxID=1305843 RepID=UPI00040B222E|nr:DUF2269 family protein [Salinispora cortesiana]